jgi:prepilin-type N-terminal cleavage/methylation domain-containing protein
MRSRSGFTLLEVLAAVALLGIVYTQLIQSGAMGLQHEGEARRRIEASLLADSVLTEIESMIEAGAPPPVGTDEREENGFRIAVAVEPFTLEIPEDVGAGGKRLAKGESRLGGGEANAPPPPSAGPSLLGGEGPASPSPLRLITVEVAWDEGFGERAARRATFALDAEAAAGTLQALAQTAAQQQATAEQSAGQDGQPGAQPLEQGRE